LCVVCGWTSTTPITVSMKYYRQQPPQSSCWCKVKLTLEQATWAKVRSRCTYIYTLPLTWELDEVERSIPRTDRSTPMKVPWCSLYMRVGGTKSRSALDVALQYTARTTAW